jgi:hypothetical protein
MHDLQEHQPDQAEADSTCQHQGYPSHPGARQAVSLDLADIELMLQPNQPGL